MSLNYYIELPCDDITDISAEIYNFLQEKTDLINSIKIGWNFINSKQLVEQSPKLLKFFKDHNLVLRHAAVTMVTENGQLPIHVDEPPVIAKINFPVINTQGWANRWYEDDQLVAELSDMKLPIVFNSQVPHSVEKTTATVVPRIVASFTFHNEPLDLLK
jgi:hypothetical protein